MSTEPVNYEAVLADLEAKKAQIDAAIAAIRALAGIGTASPNQGASQGLEPHSFLGMSIPDATKKYLSIVKRKQSTQDIMKALEAGGLPPSLYNTIYGVLRRRQKQVGDIINFKGDWALAEWYPNYKFKKSKDEPESPEGAAPEDEKTE
jgi:hypothetical protein